MDLQEIEDRIAIRDLVERYTNACTVGDWDGVGATFHEEGVWAVAPPFNLEIKGRTAIQAFISDSIQKSEFAVQMSHNVVVDLDGDQATARVVINEVARHNQPDDHSSLFMLGLYTDEITRVDGRWGFARRRFQPFYIDSTALPGMAMAPPFA